MYIGRLNRKQFPTTNHRILYFTSKELQYTRTQLLSFDPANPELKVPPLYGFPPPNLLLGYKVLIDVLNSRPFDNTTITQFTYHPIEVLNVIEQMEWSVLSSSDIYTDVSEYGNLLDLDAWDQDANNANIQDIREARNRILLNRIVNNGRNIAGTGIPIDKAAQITKLINDVRVAAFNYAILSFNLNENIYIEDEMDENEKWIENFIHKFSKTSYQEWPIQNVAPINAINLVAQAMTLGSDSTESSLWEMTGGAMRLRSGRLVGSPYRLRGPPRYPLTTQGRTTDRRTRRQIARRYVQRILNTQRQENESDENENPPQARMNNSHEFYMEMMRLLEEIARQVMDAQEANSRFLNFPNDFYASLRSHIAESISFQQEANASFIKAWLINFLIAEQLSQVLKIFSEKFGKGHPRSTFCQIILTAQSSNSQELFKRIWSTTERPYDMFYLLFKRIVKDLISTLNMILSQPEPSQPREETEAMMQESGLSDVSGNITDVLEQVTSYEEIVSISITFKLKCRGLVAYSLNNQIVSEFKKWMSKQTKKYEERSFRQPKPSKAQQ